MSTVSSHNYYHDEFLSNCIFVEYERLSDYVGGEGLPVRSPSNEALWPRKLWDLALLLGLKRMKGD